jgi:hypothetical protein
MKMPGARLALRLLSHSDAFGARAELVGDLLEETANGRSRLWLWQELIGLYGLLFLTRIRSRAHVTASAVALASCAVLLAGTLIASVGSLVEAWLGFYCVTGTLSLFAHMAARAADAHVRVTSDVQGASAWCRPAVDAAQRATRDRAERRQKL